MENKSSVPPSWDAFFRNDESGLTENETFKFPNLNEHIPFG
jgi:hypothetical protein